jgi:hypothetical protein
VGGGWSHLALPSRLHLALGTWHLALQLHLWLARAPGRRRGRGRRRGAARAASARLVLQVQLLWATPIESARLVPAHEIVLVYLHMRLILTYDEVVPAPGKPASGLAQPEQFCGPSGHESLPQALGRPSTGQILFSNLTNPLCCPDLQASGRVAELWAGREAGLGQHPDSKAQRL